MLEARVVGNSTSRVNAGSGLARDAQHQVLLAPERGSPGKNPAMVSLEQRGTPLPMSAGKTVGGSHWGEGVQRLEGP